MRNVIIMFFGGVLILMGFSACKNSEFTIIQTANQPDVRIQGKILDEYTNEPVSNAKIWVSGTTQYTYTDDQGKYDLFITTGSYVLRITHNDYDNLNKDIFLTKSNRLISEYNLKLIPKEEQVSNYSSKEDNNSTGSESVTSMQALKQENDSLRQVIKRLKLMLYPDDQNVDIEKSLPKNEGVQKLIDYFVKGGLKCEVMNPGDIIIEQTDDEDLIRLQNPVNLEIVNRYLGYRIYVDLKGFSAKKYGNILGMDSDASYYFEELEANSLQEKEQWEKNREYEFKGSFRHFLIAMASDKSPFYFGYRTYLGTFVSTASAMAFSKSSVSDVEVTKKKFIVPVNRGNTTIFNFDGELRVEYIKKIIRDPYGIMGMDTYPYLTSWLSLKGKLAEFTSNGVLLDPSDVQIKGAWRYTPVCGRLPQDYLPDSEVNN